MNCPKSLELRDSLLKNHNNAILSQTLAAKNPSVKNIMDGADMFMPEDKFSKHIDNYWLRYSELPQILSKWLKEARVATADNIKKYL